MSGRDEGDVTGDVPDDTELDDTEEPELNGAADELEFGDSEDEGDGLDEEPGQLTEDDAFRRILSRSRDRSRERSSKGARERSSEGSRERRFTLPAPLQRLYRGGTSFDFVGRRRWWFIASGTIIVAGLISFGCRGFNFGIDFKGGDSWTVTAPGVSQTTALNAVEAAGLNQPTVEILGGKTIQVTADLNGLPSPG